MICVRGCPASTDQNATIGRESTVDTAEYVLTTLGLSGSDTYIELNRFVGVQILTKRITKHPFDFKSGT